MGLEEVGEKWGGIGGEEGGNRWGGRGIRARGVSRVRDGMGEGKGGGEEGRVVGKE